MSREWVEISRKRVGNKPIIRQRRTKTKSETSQIKSGTSQKGANKALNGTQNYAFLPFLRFKLHHYTINYTQITPFKCHIFNMLSSEGVKV